MIKQEREKIAKNKKILRKVLSELNYG